MVSSITNEIKPCTVVLLDFAANNVNVTEVVCEDECREYLIKTKEEYVATGF
jgi:predicted nucleic acid-binding Zn ribbon protein